MEIVSYGYFIYNLYSCSKTAYSASKNIYKFYKWIRATNLNEVEIFQRLKNKNCDIDCDIAYVEINGTDETEDSWIFIDDIHDVEK